MFTGAGLNHIFVIVESHGRFPVLSFIQLVDRSLSNTLKIAGSVMKYSVEITVMMQQLVR